MNFSRLFGLAACLACVLSFSAFAEGEAPPPSPVTPEKTRDDWYRTPGEYFSSKSTRLLRPTDVSSKIITDGKRFDAAVGKRIPLYEWNTDGLTDGWATGVDGGMLASLTRYNSEGRFTFATNTFDGMFGAWVGFMNGDGWLAMFRAAHLSAHLVDNSPQIASAIGYSQFWNEIVVGHTWPETRRASDWDVHVQGSVGFNNTSTPKSDQPRASLATDFGYAFHGADSLGLIASADALRAGVENQSLTYVFFLGMGYLQRPQTTHRPFRAGLVYLRGSEYRNQLYFQRQNWLTFEVAAEF